MFYASIVRYNVHDLCLEETSEWFGPCDTLQQLQDRCNTDSDGDERDWEEDVHHITVLKIGPQSGRVHRIATGIIEETGVDLTGIEESCSE